MDQPRVPAWKRLGLKLKYAQDTDPAPSTLVASTSVATNGINGTSLSSPPSKKRRLEEKPSVRTSVVTNGLTRTSSLKSSASNVRKSVSFTPETKEDDGESSAFMQDKWDEEARNNQINDFLEREAEAAEAAAKTTITSAEASSDGMEPASKVKKPPKREKKKGVAEADTGPDLQPPKVRRKSKDALDYLQQYQLSRSTWKFNKNREVWLFKHVLSVQDIPSTYESTLADYLAGTKSESAKARVVDECHDFIVLEVEKQSNEADRALMSRSLKMDTKQRRLRYYESARERFKKALDSFADDATSPDAKEAQNRYERAERANSVLKSMLGADTEKGSDSEALPSAKLSDSQTAWDGVVPKAVTKKKKNRTAVVDVSSSEDTSGDSSSDNSSSDSDT